MGLMFGMRSLGEGIRGVTVGLSVVLVLLGSACPAPGTQESGLADPGALVDVIGESEHERMELRTIYNGTGGRPIWTTPAHRFALLKMLLSLEADGIDIRKLGDLGRSGWSHAQDDVIATQTILRAAHLLIADAAEKPAIPGWHIERAPMDIASIIATAAREDRLGAVLQDLRPAHPAYARLRAAYIHYLQLATEPWPPLERSITRIVEMDDPRMPEIVRRLVLLGDLNETQEPRTDLDAGIRRFQARHGLEVDGRVGPATLAQLDSAPSARAQQIAANLEYWRRLPRTWPTRYVAVNTASADLEFLREGKRRFTTRVIVGDPDHATPVIAASITAVTLNPPWTVPYSIATKEMLPRLLRERDYLERNKIEIVDRVHDPHGLEIDWSRYSRSNFPFQFRQVPGHGNALGVVKFEMDNKFSVYLHDTSDRSLFQRNARALSHGCVRVQHAQVLAEHLFDDAAIWMKTDLLAALREGRTVRVPLAEALPVYLLYFTAFADSDGVVHFRPDLYGRDAVVQQALSDRSALPGEPRMKGP